MRVAATAAAFATHMTLRRPSRAPPSRASAPPARASLAKPAAQFCDEHRRDGGNDLRPRVSTAKSSERRRDQRVGKLSGHAFHCGCVGPCLEDASGSDVDTGRETRLDSGHEASCHAASARVGDEGFVELGSGGAPALEADHRRSLRAFPSTKTEENAIAPAAKIGERSRPKLGQRAPAATGISAAL